MNDAEKSNKTASPEEKTPLASTSALIRDEVLDASITKLHGYLKIMGLGEEYKAIELGKEDIIIGRTSECKVQLPVEGVSRKHALIRFHNEEYYVEDLGSKNGAYLNGVRIAKCVLRNKDQIYIGGIKIIFDEMTSLIKT